jgi:DNA polymerase-3 subunit gamma/tau
MNNVQYYTKYRPTKFGQVIGQDVTVRIMVNSILMERVPKAILISGQYGCGKTTLARLYSKAINCENFRSGKDLCGVCESCVSSGRYSVTEVDSATDSGVDDVRKILEDSNILYDGYKVIIFDECHQLSKTSQVSLLKYLEEPPEGVVVILVTTDKARVDKAISSRCMSFVINSIVEEDIEGSIIDIASKEGIEVTEDFVRCLSSNCNNSLRDAQKMLEQCSIYSDGVLDSNILYEFYGILSLDIYKDLASILDSRNLENGLNQLTAWNKSGIDLERVFMEGVPNLLMDFRLVLEGINIKLKSGLDRDVISNNLELDRDVVQFELDVWKDLNEKLKLEDINITWKLFLMKISTGFSVEEFEC